MKTARIRDPGWKKVGSGIRDKHPGSATLLFGHPGSRISDPKTATKKRGKKILLSYFFVTTNITNRKLFLILNW
jgi:hypothetical protein